MTQDDRFFSPRRLGAIWLLTVALALASFYWMRSLNQTTALLFGEPTGTRMQVELGKPGPLTRYTAGRTSGPNRESAWQSARLMLWVDLVLVLALGLACIFGILWFRARMCAPFRAEPASARTKGQAWCAMAAAILLLAAAASAVADFAEDGILLWIVDGSVPSEGIFHALAVLQIVKMLNFFLLPTLLAGAPVLMLISRGRHLPGAGWSAY